MARKVNFLNLTIRVAKASAAEQRRAYNASIRQHNAMIKQADKEKKEQDRYRIIQEKENAITYANDKTLEADSYRNSILSILKESADKPKEFNWTQFYRKESFNKTKPREEFYDLIPKEINENDYVPKKTLLDSIFKSFYQKKLKDSQDKYKNASLIRHERMIDVEQKNKAKKSKFNHSLNEWENEKKLFEDEIIEYNKRIDEIKSGYIQSNKQSVEFYFDSIIDIIEFIDYYETQWELEYHPESKILIVDFDLPSRDDIPTLKLMKYIQTRKEFTETQLKDKEIDEIYNESLYQFSLRITNDLYVNDIDGKIDCIVFNGLHTGINKSNGKEEIKCIISLQTKKDVFSEINIVNVDAKECFVKFKGICNSKLSDLIAIAPIMPMDRDDKRFVDNVEIAHTIDGKNLAIMDWESFEHLIRELFEKEFSVNGSEVKITQASRDGGVDAVMFDPDPIRGGKYIIQAKRYTNVVGVSAVRDLYGTIMNEGAVKGILVTTATFGADSYEFAKDKPITLISGNNLLHMLTKHGYNARIDIEEARRNM